MIVMNSLAALVYLLGNAILRRSFPNAPGWVFSVLLMVSVFNLVCAIALFKWRKWGFWGFLASSVIGVVINSKMGFGYTETISGFTGVFILYGILQIGKDKKGWPQLE